MPRYHDISSDTEVLGVGSKNRIHSLGELLSLGLDVTKIQQAHTVDIA